jgi:hypothetical protein
LARTSADGAAESAVGKPGSDQMTTLEKSWARSSDEADEQKKQSNRTTRNGLRIPGSLSFDNEEHR